MTEKGAKKILIIEDEVMLADMYRSRFEHEGYEVHSAFDAEEGMEMAKEVRPDLIVLDILLPRDNGTDFLEKLRKEEGIETTKVIAYSNYDDLKSREKALNLGARDYLIKTNHTPKEILEIVKKHLDS